MDGSLFIFGCFLVTLPITVFSSCVDFTGTKWTRLDIDDTSQNVLHNGRNVTKPDLLSRLSIASLTKYSKANTKFLTSPTFEYVLSAYEKMEFGPDYCIRFTAHSNVPCKESSERGSRSCRQFYECDTEIDSIWGRNGVERMAIMDTSCREEGSHDYMHNNMM